MDQVKRRLELVARITSRKITTGDDSADAEFACLQLRKTLEQIAYSALAASRDHYAAARPHVEREWNATKILERLEKLHKDFYPVPLSIERVADDRVHATPLTDGFLAKSDFVFLYDKCSDAIHDWNPFRPGPRIIELQRPIEEWTQRIHRLLSQHWIQLLGEQDRLVIDLCGPGGKAHVLTVTPR
jgi:hypothetical protein